MPHATFKNLSLTILLMNLCIYSAFAAWITKHPVIESQPDGSKIECFASGDEYHNWLHDKDNFTIIRNPKTGYLSYALQDGDYVRASDFIVGSKDPSTLGIKAGINISERAYQEKRRTLFQSPPQRSAPTTGTINNLVVFIRFANESEINQPISLYNGWFNTNNSSQKNYFLEASYNQLTVDTHFYPQAQNGMVVSWQDIYPRSYFQPYDPITNPNGYTESQRANREFSLLQRAISGVEDLIPTNINFDSDNDGRVDNVVFIVKGNTTAWSTLLWPHRWSLYDRTVLLHGKRVYDFNFQLEQHLLTKTVGVLCHEFFHSLGAPDLYRYVDTSIEPVGSWDLMGFDLQPPQHMTAFMKYKYGHWIDEIPTIQTLGEYTLNSLVSPTNNCYKIESGNPNEYYVLEYRKQDDGYEMGLPGSGLLVYRINTLAGNGNAQGPPDELYIYRPGGTVSSNGTVGHAFFNQSSGRTAINNNTNPTPFLSDGSIGNLNIHSIGSSLENTISFFLEAPKVDFSTNPYTQGFEDSTFPPEGWTGQALNGTQTFEKVSSGTNPLAYPHQGQSMLSYKSRNASAGSSAILSSLAVQCSDVQNSIYNTSFYMYRDSGQANRADRIEFYLSTKPDLSGNNILIDTIHRHINLSPIASAQGWHQYSFQLPLQEPGYYYLIFKAISDAGNNIYLDDFAIQRNLFLPGVPSNPLPQDNATGISLNPTLSWQAGSGLIDHFKLYFGTNNPPSNIINGQNIGSSTSYALAFDLQYDTRYYWQIVPTNASGNPSNCPVWHFNTYLDPAQQPLPYVQNFESLTVPDLPYDWSNLIQSSNPNVFVRSVSLPNYSTTPPNSVIIFNSADANADLRLISPFISRPLQNVSMSFYARGNAANYSLVIGTMGSGSSDFHPIKTFILGNQFQKYSLNFASYVGSNRHIVFKHGLGGTSRAIYIDNIQVDNYYSHDLAALSPEGSKVGAIGKAMEFSITISNKGSQAQDSYSVQLCKYPSLEVLSQKDVDSSLAAGESITHLLQWTPDQAFEQMICAKVLSLEDEYLSNNSSQPISIDVGNHFVICGNILDASQSNSLPFGFNLKNSLSESIYLASELEMLSGTITALSLDYDFLQELLNQNIKIWMKNTDSTNLNSGWQSFDGYALTFDSVLDFQNGKHNILIQLQNPFEYTGSNLAIRFYRPMDEYNYHVSNTFAVFNSLNNPARSRFLSSSTLTYDPSSPTASGTLSNLMPVIGFSAQNAVTLTPDTPIVQINQNHQTITLNWESIADVSYYLIFASPDPLSWPAEATFQTSNTSIDIPQNGSKMFYKVIAIR